MKRAALALLLLASCSSGSSFTVRVSAVDALGNFNAVTTNTGENAGEASCTVRAYDVFGNRIGFDIFDTSIIAPGESLEWNGQVGIDEPADRYDGECE